MPDVRVILRTLVRQPTLNALAVIALSLGIGLTAMMFSIVYGVVLRGLPFERPEQLVHVARSRISAGIPRMQVTIHDFVDWRTQQRTLEDLAAYKNRSVALARSAEAPVRLQGAEITPSAFRLLRAQPLLGRTFLDDEQGTSAPDVIVLSYHVWRDQFDRDPQIIGRIVHANGRPTVVIGVMPDGFTFPFRHDVWMPLRLDPLRVARGQGDTLEVFGRLRDRIPRTRATRELADIAATLARIYPESNRGVGVAVQPYIQRYVGDSGVLALYAMLGAVFGVLLVACVNVANLSLARVAIRSRQIAIQVSLGATRTRVLLDVLVETSVLAATGAGLGAGLAKLGIDAFNRALPAQNLPFWVAVTLDPAVLGFVLALAVASTVLAGIVPAIRAAHIDVNEVLRGESHGATSLRVGRVSRALVMVEVALSSALLVGAAVMVRGVVSLERSDWGFPADQIFTARVDLPDTYNEASQTRFVDRLLQTLYTQPGVQRAALTTALPVVGSPRSRIVLEGQNGPSFRDAPMAHHAAVTPTFFETFAINVVEGRSLAETDREAALPVAVINRTFARQHLQTRDVVGHRFRSETSPDGGWLTIVGVVDDAHMDDVAHPSHIDAGYYVPLAQAPARSLSLAVRTEGAASALGLTIGRTVFATDPDTVVYLPQTMRAAIGESTWFYGLFARLFGVFGVAALALGTIGLYGVLMFSVRQRTREIGVRMALGATTAQVLRLIVFQGLGQFGIGLTVGLMLAVGLARMLVALIYGAQRGDLLTFALVSVVLTVTALVACFVPAHFATKIDPMQALRAE
jgi:predicted permease